MGTLMLLNNVPCNFDVDVFSKPIPQLELTFFFAWHWELNSVGDIWFDPDVNGNFRNQEPLEVPIPYIIRPFFKAYVREYPQKIWPYMVQYLHFRILKFPLMMLQWFSMMICLFVFHWNVVTYGSTYGYDFIDVVCSQCPMHHPQ
jgi:hypothetical protein